MKIQFDEMDYNARIQDVLEGLEKSIPNTQATKNPEMVDIPGLKEAVDKVRREIHNLGMGKGALSSERMVPQSCRDPFTSFMKSPNKDSLEIFLRGVKIDFGAKISDTFREWFKDVFTE